jgi:glycerol-3-phosphate dehydrogenase subunit B
VSPHPDVIVIGAGLAGLTAAVRLSQAGADVLVLAKGVGSTHLGGGTIDLLGYDPERVTEPLAAIAALVAQQPAHPYALAGADHVAPAVDWFTRTIAAGRLAPYRYVGSIDDNLLLPSAAGAWRPSAIVPETMAAGDLRDTAPICVVGFRALKDFQATLLADTLVRAGRTARAVVLDLEPEGRSDANGLAFARGLDDPRFRGRLAGLLAARLHAGERVALPAVLGFADPHAAWDELQRALGHPVFEVPTLPPSVPGMRVYAALHEALLAAGGRLILNNTVVGAQRSETDGALTALRVKVGLREQLRRAGHVVLATGGIAAGGIEVDSHWNARELALGLPVHGVPGAGEGRFSAEYFTEHPIDRAGIAADARLRPLDSDGHVVAPNVLVAGATLGGAAPWREKSGDGISLVTGHRAASLILEDSSPVPRSAAAAAGG